MNAGFISQLQSIVGKDHVSVRQADTAVYAYDASLSSCQPGVVVFPRDTAEVSRVARLAAQRGIPYLPRGFGTNLSGGTVPVPEGLIICLSRLNRILDIQPDLGLAVVQPGVTNLELQDRLAPLGFFYAPDPASQKVATLGGNVGEDSGGPRCVKYGVTKNHVLGLETVLPGGDVLQLGGPCLDPPGFDLRGLVIGSEGTLGIVTAITVRILPSPESVITLLAVFDRIPDAARTVSAIIAQGIQPSALEMMDNPVMQAVEASMPCGYPLDASAVLIIEVDGPAAGLEEQAGRIREICASTGVREVRLAADATERNQLWAGRRGAFGAVARLAPNYLVADCTVPRTELPAALEQVAAIAASHKLEHGNVFHAGDGNLHPLLFFDSRNSDQVREVKKAGWEIMQACVRLGGTISGEHGIGLEKMEAMRLVFPERTLDFQRAIKQAFDPGHVLNPGKILPSQAPTREETLNAGALPCLSHDELHPESAEEAAAMVRAAREDRQPLLALGLGDAPSPAGHPAIPIRSTGLTRVLDFSAPNQTIRVQAGMLLKDLQAFLADHNLWFPLRPLTGDESTLGGLAAVNGCGPERLVYGAMQDRVLGLGFVSGRGHRLQAGGQVIKNVAGYDLCRLLVGSRGRLGFLTDLTLRLGPRPQALCSVAASGPLETVVWAATRVRRSPWAPASITASPAGGSGDWLMHIGFEGLETPVQWQASQCSAELESCGLEVATTRLRPTDPLPGRPGNAAKPFAFRVDQPLSRIAEADSTIPPGPGVESPVLDLQFGRLTAFPDSLDPVQWSAIMSRARESGGHAVLEKAPGWFRAQAQPWLCEDTPRTALEKRLEAGLDPAGVFAHPANPFAASSPKAGMPGRSDSQAAEVSP